MRDTTSGARYINGWTFSQFLPSVEIKRASPNDFAPTRDPNAEADVATNNEIRLPEGWQHTEENP
jgi:hypothetical protein